MLPEIRNQSLVCLLGLLLSLLYGCAAKSVGADLPPQVVKQRIIDLNLAILELGDDIDPDEAHRAARIAVEYSQQLAQEYEISGSPLVHNLLVNIGVKPRGLCVDWTRDLLTRLRQERFRSLDLHWAIANYETLFRLEHSTVVVSARGDGLEQGLVLDPWRNSGELYWSPVRQDPGYVWKPQAEIHALKRQHEYENRNRSYLR